MWLFAAERHHVILKTFQLVTARSANNPSSGLVENAGAGLPKFKDRREAVAAVFSQMRSVGVPLGMSDPDKPNISSTLWRT
jgi:hypothetical protein